MNRRPGIGGTDRWSISGQQMGLEVIDLGPVSLPIRPQVAWRRFTLDGNDCCYLSLLDREVERRVASFARRVRERQFTPSAIRALGLCLEPTDALIVVSRDDVIGWKGGACAIPLYWRLVGEQIVITTRLPHPSESGLSRHGLIASFAVVGTVLQNDQNLILRSPLVGWTRVRRGAATRWSGRAPSFSFAEVPIDFAEAPLLEHLLHYDGIVEELRSQIELFGESQADAGLTAFELSGGMDSTVAAWAARRGGRPLGISISFPFYEFRFEEGIQMETAKALDAERAEVDGRKLYAYAPQEHRLSLDEPAIISMIAKREETFARIARNAGADTILVGEGGDQLLSEHLLQPMQVSDQIDRSVMRVQGRLALNNVLREMHTAPVDYLNRSTLNFSYDARLVPAIKERWKVTTRTPFTDLGMTMCGIAYARWCARHGFNPGKKILVEAFADILPEAILQRRGKVSWEGVYARTYVANEDSLSEEFESCHEALEEIGFDVQWLLGRVRALGRLEATEYGRDDREVMSAYAIAYWLNEKRICKRIDCTWVD
jgi:hypothetical protein